MVGQLNGRYYLACARHANLPQQYMLTVNGGIKNDEIA